MSELIKNIVTIELSETELDNVAGGIAKVSTQEEIYDSNPDSGLVAHPTNPQPTFPSLPSLPSLPSFPSITLEIPSISFPGNVNH
ncbi:hypothetical protein H6G04_24055 [Calothrix membranacea FACHB-236]|nr:hypothetical protein [Calothrix membranacea FACHB-236]